MEASQVRHHPQLAHEPRTGRPSGSPRGCRARPSWRSSSAGRAARGQRGGCMGACGGSCGSIQRQCSTQRRQRQRQSQQHSAGPHLQELVKIDGAGAVLVDVGNHLQRSGWGEEGEGCQSAGAGRSGVFRVRWSARAAVAAPANAASSRRPHLLDLLLLGLKAQRAHGHLELLRFMSRGGM